MIEGGDGFIDDFSIPVFELMDEEGEDLIELHVGMMGELIEIDLGQVRGGEEVGDLLGLNVAFVLAHHFVDGGMFTVGLDLFLHFDDLCFRIRN